MTDEVVADEAAHAALDEAARSAAAEPAEVEPVPFHGGSPAEPTVIDADTQERFLNDRKVVG